MLCFCQTTGRTHDAKKAMKMTLGFSKMDFHMDFFSTWMRGLASTSTEFFSAMMYHDSKSNEC